MNTSNTTYVTDRNGNPIMGWSHFLQASNSYGNTQIKGENIMNEAYNSLAVSATGTLKSKTSNPRCKQLLDLWYDKSKTNIYIAINTKCGELLEKDPLTQKIIQVLQTIRVQWGTEYPGEDDERQKQYKEGPGYFFEAWMGKYNSLTSTNKKDVIFYESIYFDHLTYTAPTAKLFNILKEKSQELLKDLKYRYDEILTQIKAADTYEQEINILKAYGVLDYNGIISPAEADELKVPLTLEE